MAKQKCNVCGKLLKNGENVLEHLKKMHVGKLSKESIEYLIELGVSLENLVNSK